MPTLIDRRGALRLAALWAAALAAPLPLRAFDETSTAAINVDADGLGLRGWDPVSYQSGAPRMGDAAFAAEHAGARYHFADAASRDAFLADPARFAPRFGGFCQFGVALGKKLDGDPEVWRVADGQLFVYAYPAAKEGFLKDVPGNTAKAEANWPGIRDAAPQDR